MVGLLLSRMLQVSPGCGVPERVALTGVFTATVALPARRAGATDPDGLVSVPVVAAIVTVSRAVLTVAAKPLSWFTLKASASANSCRVATGLTPLTVLPKTTDTDCVAFSARVQVSPARGAPLRVAVAVVPAASWPRARPDSAGASPTSKPTVKVPFDRLASTSVAPTSLAMRSPTAALIARLKAAAIFATVSMTTGAPSTISVLPTRTAKPADPVTSRRHSSPATGSPLKATLTALPVTGVAIEPAAARPSATSALPVKALPLRSVTKSVLPTRYAVKPLAAPALIAPASCAPMAGRVWALALTATA